MLCSRLEFVFNTSCVGEKGLELGVYVGGVGSRWLGWVAECVGGTRCKRWADGTIITVHQPSYNTAAWVWLHITI